MKYFAAAILCVMASVAHADDSQFRQCARSFNDVEAKEQRLQSAVEQQEELHQRVVRLDQQIEFARPFANDYNSKMRLQSMIMEYNAMANESNNQLRGIRSQQTRYEAAVAAYNNECGEQSVNEKSAAWQDICVKSEQYRGYCATFGRRNTD